MSMAFEYDGTYASLAQNADYKRKEYGKEHFPMEHVDERMTIKEQSSTVEPAFDSIGDVWNSITGAAEGGLKVVAWAPYLIVTALVFGGIYATVSLKREFYDSPKEGE